ncbi:alpha-1,3-arabinosyltransferase XAT2-like isoform X1 [Pistacia vera]|uniref:alpha-1,3-arabinosyltransferase XAT2-like isoform X1 n=1 Tax=Pistacia vera TaxID=55513 RepID=UPI00126349F9|nr:alpha-1,3-arabinosyltransferase XAT2-like isoform X1 [Pistacia vera]
MKKQNLTTVSICFVFFVFFFMFQSKYVSLVSNSKVSRSTIIDQGKKDLVSKSTKNWVLDHHSPPPLHSPRGRLITCDRSHQYYDLCSINGPTVLDPATSTFFLQGPSTMTFPSMFKEKIRPYPRKFENFVMKGIKELTITSAPQRPKCEIQHNVPALVFSAGGYTGNFWHEFNDGFIPLFITVSSVFPDQDFVLVISKARHWWVNKYAELLQAFSKHPIINLDNDTVAHCFTSATLGLISHGFMNIDPALIPNSRTFIHFRAFLEKAYGSHGQIHPSKNNSPLVRPRLVLVSRRDSLGRVINNEAKAKLVLEKIGFDVIVFEPNPGTPLNEAYAIINSSHAMVGVHGAALTHSLFLRPGSVFVQVVPLGLDWVAQVCFAKSARAMRLEYMEYKIKAEESSLVEKYNKNDLLIKDPVAFRGKNWSEDIMNIYLKEQNVNFDLVRFGEYFKQVYKKAKQFMDKER